MDLRLFFGPMGRDAMERTRKKTEFVAFRLSQAEARRLNQIRREIGAESNSAALRWLVSNHGQQPAQQPADVRAEVTHG